MPKHFRRSSADVHQLLVLADFVVFVFVIVVVVVLAAVVFVFFADFTHGGPPRLACGLLTMNSARRLPLPLPLPLPPFPFSTVSRSFRLT